MMSFETNSVINFIPFNNSIMRKSQAKEIVKDDSYNCSGVVAFFINDYDSKYLKYILNIKFGTFTSIREPLDAPFDSIKSVLED